MARNRRNGCGCGWNGNTADFVAWNGCGNNTCGNTWNNNGCGCNTCGNTWNNNGCGCNTCGNTWNNNGCGCNTCGNTWNNNGCGCNACGRAFSFNNNCPFQNSCPYPMTFEEMLNLLSGLRYGRLAVCADGVAYVTPVCFSVRNCDEAPIFTLRVRTDGCLMERLQDNERVTLQFDRTVNGGVCTVQVFGTARVTGSTGCVAIIEVHTDSMMGECFRNNGCGCGCNGDTAAANNGNGCGCQNDCDNNCNNCNNNCNTCN